MILLPLGIIEPKKTDLEVPGCYLLHFSEPIGSDLHRASHYLGWAKSSIAKRFAQHAAGHPYSASITKNAVSRGVTLTVARIWPDTDRTFERHLKNRKNSAYFCPICWASKGTK